MIMTWRERLKEYLSKYGDAPSDATAQAMQAEIDELRVALATARAQERERCENSLSEVSPRGYGYKGHARDAWDEAIASCKEAIRNLTDEG